MVLIQTKNKHAVADIRRFFFELVSLNWEVPDIIKKEYFQKTKDEFQLSSSTDIGSLLLDGFGDGVWLCSDFSNDINTKLSFGILQATRTRISKTEYKSCPSCGRTLFDLQKVTGEIRSRTNHLKGVKIGIMGCIVNGPGEMADADYGYVGTGVGQISLYKGYEVVIWPSSLKEKDLNDMFSSGHDVQSMVEFNTYRGLEAKIKLSEWKKV